MPKKKVSITYLCEICLSGYKNRIDALACENSGVAIPEFKCHEVVQLVGLSAGVNVTPLSGFKFELKNGILGIIHDIESYVDLNINPHLLPAGYSIWIRTLSEPSQRELINISREKLRKVTVREGTACLLCASRIETKKDFYSPVFNLGSKLPFLKDIPICCCLNCNAEFFTTKQSRNVDLLIQKKIKWPLADTRHLVRKCQFQY